jgi:hypothetical protein
MGVAQWVRIVRVRNRVNKEVVEMKEEGQPRQGVVVAAEQLQIPPRWLETKVVEVFNG